MSLSELERNRHAVVEKLTGDERFMSRMDIKRMIVDIVGNYKINF